LQETESFDPEQVIWRLLRWTKLRAQSKSPAAVIFRRRAAWRLWWK